MQRLACLFCALAFTLMSVQAYAAENVIKMTMAGFMMDKHPTIQNVYLPWTEEIKKRTNGRVEITYFNPGSICAEADVYDALLKGQVSIGTQMTARNIAKVPYGTIMGVPSALSSSISATNAWWRMYRESPAMREEFANMKLLSLTTSVPVQLVTVKDPIRSLEELNSKKIIVSTGDAARIFRALGTNPIVLPPVDIYLSLSRGMGDGTILPIPAVRSFKVGEATKYITRMNMLFTANWVGMNLELWNSLPPDIQQVFEELSGQPLSMKVANVLNAAEKNDTQELERGGMQFINLTPEERARWVSLALPIGKQNWISVMEKRGLQDVESEFNRAMKIIEEEEDKYQKTLQSGKLQ